MVKRVLNGSTGQSVRSRKKENIMKMIVERQFDIVIYEKGDQSQYLIHVLKSNFSVPWIQMWINLL